MSTTENNTGSGHTISCEMEDVGISLSKISSTNSVGSSDRGATRVEVPAVTERLAVDCVITRCKVTNMPHLREVGDLEVMANMYCFQCGLCNGWLEGLVPFQELYARAIGMLRKNIGMGLVDMQEIWKVSAKFDRELMEKNVHPGSERFERMFYLSMDELSG